MKGFYSSSIIIVLLLLTIILFSTQMETTNSFDKIKNELIKTEMAEKERTIMENNVDKIIKLKLEEQIEKGNFEIDLIQDEINSALLKYLSGKAKETNYFYEEEKELTKEFLNLNSTAFLLQTNGKKFAEYTFTSNQLTQKIVSKKNGDNILLYFKIPIGYTQWVLK